MSRTHFKTLMVKQKREIFEHRSTAYVGVGEHRSTEDLLFTFARRVLK